MSRFFNVPVPGLWLTRQIRIIFRGLAFPFTSVCLLTCEKRRDVANSGSDSVNWGCMGHIAHLVILGLGGGVSRTLRVVIIGGQQLPGPPRVVLQPGKVWLWLA